MELRLIKSFLSIAEILHIGRSAELIHLSQPALTLQIQALEEEVGGKLLERNRRGTKVTVAGVAFGRACRGQEDRPIGTPVGSTVSLIPRFLLSSF